MKPAPYQLVLDDGGRNWSKRPLQKNDCTVRALATLTQRNYDEIYDLLKKAGRKSHEGFDLDGWLRVSPCRLFHNVMLTKVNKKGLTVCNFASKHPKGRFLLQTDSHCWPVVDGVHYDLIRVKDQKLCSVWRVE
jgi:hypothetical protein